MEVALRELGPTLTWSGLALLAIGSTTVALVIFGPAHKRLRSLEAAARALGQGQIDVRADDRGGDEVSALARTFNGMAAELQARSAALSASDRARRQLLADVSHELMTPLTAIRGYTQTLAMPGLAVDPPTRARYFDIVDRETYKLEAIIGDLLDLAKLEGGGGTLSIEPVAVADLFDRIAERHEPTLRARNITLEQHVADDLELDADVQRLEQALQNVASNALRHTPDGGRLELGARRSICRTSSIASTRRIRPGPRRALLPAAVSASPSCARLSSVTAAPSARRMRRTEERSSRSSCPRNGPTLTCKH
jgi:signal transduction histidine kinase